MFLYAARKNILVVPLGMIIVMQGSAQRCALLAA